MKRFQLLLLAVLVVSLSVHGLAVGPAPVDEGTESPGGTFKAVRHMRLLDNGFYEYEVWLEGIDKGFKRQRLATYEVYGPHLIISDDDRFIAINHKLGSNVSELNLYALGADGLFHAVKADFMTRNIQRIKTHLKLSAKAEFGSAYWVANTWLRDGLLLAHFGGRWDEPEGNHAVTHWYFIYDVKKDEVSWDLEKINQPGFSSHQKTVK